MYECAIEWMMMMYTKCTTDDVLYCYSQTHIGKYYNTKCIPIHRVWYMRNISWRILQIFYRNIRENQYHLRMRIRSPLISGRIYAWGLFTRAHTIALRSKSFTNRDIFTSGNNHLPHTAPYANTLLIKDFMVIDFLSCDSICSNFQFTFICTISYIYLHTSIWFTTSQNIHTHQALRALRLHFTPRKCCECAAHQKVAKDTMRAVLLMVECHFYSTLATLCTARARGWL